MRAALALVVLAAAACGACSSGGSDGRDGAERPREEPVVGGTLRIGVQRLPSLDPAAASPATPSTSIVADLLYDGVPAFAEPGQTPDGGRTWRFVLRPGVTFGDGSPITSLDVEASLERVPGRPAGLDVVAVDAATFDVVLQRPMASLPEVLAMPAYGIAPGAALLAGDFQGAAAVGSGPFRLAAVDGDVLRLVRAREGSARLDGIDVHQFDALGDAYDAFEAGTVDWALLPPERAEEAAERYGADGFLPSPATLLYTIDAAALPDVAHRRAIVAAVDTEAAVRAVYGIAAEPIAAPAVEAPPVPGPEVVVDDGTTPADAAMARAIQEQLVDAGIPASVADTGAVRPLVVVGDDVGRFRSDPAVAAVLDQLAVTFDPAERDRLAAEAERLLLESAVVLPVARFRTLSVAADRVRDLQLGPSGSFAGELVWLAD